MFAGRLVLVPTVLLAAGLAGCGDDGRGDTATFCNAVREHADQLVNAMPATQADVEAYVELYETVGAHAPLAVEADWDVMTNLYRTAASVLPNDAPSADAARAAAFAAEESSQRVIGWIATNCQLDLRTVGPVVGGGPVTPTPTTTTGTGIPADAAPPTTPPPGG